MGCANWGSPIFSVLATTRSKLPISSNRRLSGGSLQENNKDTQGKTDNSEKSMLVKVVSFIWCFCAMAILVLSVLALVVGLVLCFVKYTIISVSISGSLFLILSFFVIKNKWYQIWW